MDLPLFFLIVLFFFYAAYIWFLWKMDKTVYWSWCNYFAYCFVIFCTKKNWLFYILMVTMKNFFSHLVYKGVGFESKRYGLVIDNPYNGRLYLWMHVIGLILLLEMLLPHFNSKFLHVVSSPFSLTVMVFIVRFIVQIWKFHLSIISFITPYKS